MKFVRFFMNLCRKKEKEKDTATKTSNLIEVTMEEFSNE
jgi:hypothetical protein